VTVAEVFAYTVPGRIRQARAAVLSTIPEEAPPKVLNFVVFPDFSYDLPIFGADFVSLPGGHLVVLDFQPVSSTSLSVAEKALRDIHAHYSALLPSHGEIPDAARSFFSPYYMFIRVEGDALVE
ncbi:phycoerythrobilin:ferredoxin oxidoreductase, partial [Nannochloropsis gaditana CCMP526]